MNHRIILAAVALWAAPAVADEMPELCEQAIIVQELPWKITKLTLEKTFPMSDGRPSMTYRVSSAWHGSPRTNVWSCTAPKPIPGLDLKAPELQLVSRE